MKHHRPSHNRPRAGSPADHRRPRRGACAAAAAVTVLAVAAGCFSPPARGRLGTAPAKSEDPTKPGLQMGAPWTGWDDARERAFRFADIRTFQVPDGDALENAASPFAQSRVTARWLFARQADTRMTATPPIELKGPFDSVELWAGLEGAASGSASPVGIDLLARDAGGRLQEWPMGTLRPGEWAILHHRLPWRSAETAGFPFRLEAVRVRCPGAGTPDTARGVLCLEHLTVYAEDQAPIVPAWRADVRNFQSPMEAVIHGVREYWSEDDRLHPVGSEARVTLIREAAGAWRWECRTDDRGWAYRLDPARWWSEGVELCERAGREWKVRGRWRGLDLPEAALRAVRANPASLHLARADGWSADIGVHRGALVVDLARESRDPLVLRAGGFDAAGRAYRLNLPWFNDRQQGPPLALLLPADPAAAPWVASVWFDPRRSSASALDFMDAPSAQPVGWLEARYAAGPDGRAPAVRERLILNVTPRIQEALPSMRPPPDGPRGPALWVSSDPALAKMQRAELHAQGWPGDAMPEPAFVSRPDPQAPGDMDRLVVARDAVRRTPEGQWARSPSGAPQVKWPWLAFAHEPASGSDPSAIAYAWAGRPCAEAVDFDPRSARDAGRLAGPYEAVARCMDRARDAGLALAPAPAAWWYAGRANIAWCAADDARRAARRPEVAWWALSGAMIPAVPVGTDDPHPGRTVLALMGSPALGSITDRVAIARFATLAYELAGPLRKLPRIRAGYYAANDLVAFPDAVLQGGSVADRLYAELEGPVEVCLNLSDSSAWTARLGGQPWTLPPGGWVVDGPQIQAAVATSGAGRLEFIRTPRRLFWNSDADASWEGIQGNSPFLATALEGDEGWSVRMLREGGGRHIRLPLPPDATGASAFVPDAPDVALTVREDARGVDIPVPDDGRGFEVRWIRP